MSQIGTTTITQNGKEKNFIIMENGDGGISLVKNNSNSNNEIQPSNNEIQPSNNEIQPSNNEIQPSNNEIQPSNNNNNQMVEYKPNTGGKRRRTKAKKSKKTKTVKKAKKIQKK
jgi:hypothetical protein